MDYADFYSNRPIAHPHCLEISSASAWARKYGGL